MTPIAAAVAQTVAGQAGEGRTEEKTEALETVVVTGIRASLESAQRVKRNAATVVEAITPEDLGKFTDNSIADQLQRVPGVQIDRNTDGRSGDHVSVRGIGGEYVTTTINGRSPGGYGKEGQQFLRQFAVEVLPGEILSGALVYKTSSAEMIEPGMGGAVDFQTLRPLDYKLKDGKQYFGSFTVKGNESSGSGATKFGNGVSGIVGGKLVGNTLGFVVAAMTSKNPYQMDFMEGNSVSQQTLNVQAADGTVSRPSVIFYNNFTIGRSRRDDQRHAISGDLQWKPTENWDINVDYLSSKLNRFDNRDTYVADFSANNILNGTFLPGGVTISHGAVTALDMTKYLPPDASDPNSGKPGVLGFPIDYNNYSTTKIGGLNAKWHSDKLKVEGDLSFNKTQTFQNLGWFYASYTYPSFTGLNYTSNTSGPASINVGAPALSLSDFNTIGALRRYFKMKNEGGEAHLSASYELSDNDTLKVGFRHSTADVDTRNAYNSSFALTGAQNTLLQGILYPGGTDNLLAGHTIGNFGSVPAQSPSSVNGSAFFNPAFDFNQAPFGGDFSNASQAQGAWSGNADPSIGYIYANKEKVDAVFGQLDFENTFWGMPVDGNVGLRLVRTENRARAFQTITTVNNTSGTDLHTESFIPAEAITSHTNALPSLNITLHPNQDTNLRFGVGKTMSRPEYLDMAPNNNLTVPSAALLLTNPDSRGTGTAGNQNLKPATSWNFDSTLEYYTRSGASYVASLFYKRVSNFIAPVVTLNTTLPGYGSMLFNVTQPQNMSKGHAAGMELGLNQPLRALLPELDGFGIQANFTYVDSAIDQPISGQKVSFPGVSKRNVNGIAYYSKGDWDARVAVTYRSAYLSQFPWAGYVPYPLFTDPLLNVDASATYKVTEHMSVTVSASNLTRQNRRDYLTDTTVFEHYYEVPRTYALALRASF
ncbi:MAG TPA: TonB-dependent receptor [Burkholderiaceae bacterium]